jgi:hypothetical protein
MQQNGGSVMVISDYIPADKYQQNANVDVLNGGFGCFDII